MTGGRVGFLVAGLWERGREEYAALLKKCFFDQFMFCMLPFNVAAHLCCDSDVFGFFRVSGRLAHCKTSHQLEGQAEVASGHDLVLQPFTESISEGVSARGQ